jgi:hypothetical protein
MLKILRNKKTAKKIWLGLALIIVPAFVLWGAGSTGRSRDAAPYAGTLFGRKITLLEYRDAFNAVNNRAVMRYGEKLEEMKKYMNFEAQAWERLMLLADARQKRISASDKEVINAIESYGFFQKGGVFDQRIYNELLQYVFHVQARSFEEQVRQDIILAKLFDRITKGVSVSDGELRQEYQKANEQVSLYYIAALPADFAKDIKPTDDQVKDYFAKNSLSFKQPLSFDIAYAAYDAKGQDAQQAKQTLEKVFGRLNKKEDFATVAKDFTMQFKETGLFSETDPIPGIGWAPEVTGLIARTAPGEYLPAVKMDQTYYIVKVKERKEPYVPEFDAAKDKVRDAIIKGQSQAIAREKIDAARKKMPDDFDKTAQALGVKSGSTNLFTYGSYIEGIGSSDLFWTKAKELKAETPSDVLETPGGFYIIKVKSTVGIDEKKFSDEKKAFAEKLLAQKQSEYFADYLAGLKQKAQLTVR